jgi:hypothetical protein
VGKQLSISERTKIKRMYMRWAPVLEIKEATGRSRRTIEDMILKGGWKEKREVSTREIMERLDVSEIDPILKEIQNSQEIAGELLGAIKSADLSEAKLEVMLREYRKYADRALQLQGLGSATPQVVINAPGAQVAVIPEEELRLIVKKAQAEKKKLKGD